MCCAFFTTVKKTDNKLALSYHLGRSTKCPHATTIRPGVSLQTCCKEVAVAASRGGGCSCLACCHYLVAVAFSPEAIPHFLYLCCHHLWLDGRQGQQHGARGLLDRRVTIVHVDQHALQGGVAEARCVCVCGSARPAESGVGTWGEECGV